jgi:metallophosphoesterase superfamily enzyme
MGLDERTNDSSGTLVILPSFNPLLAGLAINMPQTRLQGPFYDNGCFNLDRAEVYSTQGIFLGTVQSLKRKA